MPIITDGLVGYWNFRQGVSGNTWQNIAPSTKGKYNGTMVGPVLQATGMYFDGVDDYVEIDKIIELDKITSFTLEFRCRLLEYTWDSPVNTKNFGFWWGGSGIGTWLGDSESEINGTFHSATTHQITLIYDTTRPANDLFVWYVNGKPDYPGYSSAGILESMFKDSSKLYLGDAEFTSIFGHMLFTRFYSRVLTAQEIQQNYAMGDEVGLPTGPDPIIHNMGFQAKGIGKLNVSPVVEKTSVTHAISFNAKGIGKLNISAKKEHVINTRMVGKGLLSTQVRKVQSSALTVTSGALSSITGHKTLSSRLENMSNLNQIVTGGTVKTSNNQANAQSRQAVLNNRMRTSGINIQAYSRSIVSFSDIVLGSMESNVTSSAAIKAIRVQGSSMESKPNTDSRITPNKTLRLQLEESTSSLLNVLGYKLYQGRISIISSVRVQTTPTLMKNSVSNAVVQTVPIQKAHLIKLSRSNPSSALYTDVSSIRNRVSGLSTKAHSYMTASLVISSENYLEIVADSESSFIPSLIHGTGIVIRVNSLAEGSAIKIMRSPLYLESNAKQYLKPIIVSLSKHLVTQESSYTVLPIRILQTGQETNSRLGFIIYNSSTTPAEFMVGSNTVTTFVANRTSGLELSVDSLSEIVSQGNVISFINSNAFSKLLSGSKANVLRFNEHHIKAISSSKVSWVVMEVEGIQLIGRVIPEIAIIGKAPDAEISFKGRVVDIVELGGKIK